MLRNIILSISILTVCMGADTPEPHRWVDATGRYQAEAVFAGVGEQNVYLRSTQDATVIEVPLARLSKEDRRFVTDKYANCKKIKGKVVGVVDGDTIKVLEFKGDEKQQHKIRFAHIDAPESSQPFGKTAKQVLSKKVFGKEVRVIWCANGRYGRIIADVYLDTRYINGEMVRKGLAWHYKKYSKSKALADLEKQARKARAGVWAMDSPVPPWDYRRDGRSR